MDVIFHPDYLLHRHRGAHPERPERLNAVLERLELEDLAGNISIPEPATEDVLMSVHSKDYVISMGEYGAGYIDGGDTYLGENTYDIALLAAGGARLSSDLAKKGKASMALLRPPGHHAGAYYGGGFCYFNNIAIAAAFSEMKKVAILDFDGHHGNGTSDIFYSSNDVLFISTHHYGIYPGTGDSIAIGENEGEGYNVNIPFRTGVGDSSIEYAWNELIEPLLQQYTPQMILVSLGTDGHYADGMTGLSLSSRAYLDMAKRTIDLSDKLCKGRTAFFLEGGYHLGSLEEIIAGIIAYTEGRGVKLEWTDEHDNRCLGREAVDRTKHCIDDHWNLS